MTDVLEGGPPLTAAGIRPDLSFVVWGTPQQQGSKKSVLNKERTRALQVDANAKKLKPWRQEALAAAAATDGDPFPAGVIVGARFYFGRPASHYGTGRNAGVLKASAPIFKTSAPDLDKLQRAVGDVLKMSGLVRDDAKIVMWLTPAKLYGDRPRTEIDIWDADAFLQKVPFWRRFPGKLADLITRMFDHLGWWENEDQDREFE